MRLLASPGLPGLQIGGVGGVILNYSKTCLKQPLKRRQNKVFNNLEKTDPSEIERTYNIKKQQTQFY